MSLEAIRQQLDDIEQRVIAMDKVLASIQSKMGTLLAATDSRTTVGFDPIFQRQFDEGLRRLIEQQRRPKG